jgi:hypothetical protein
MTENVISVATKINWASLSGVTLEGGCELKDVLEVREDGARLRVRLLGSGGRMGVAYFLNLEPKEAEDQVDIWETLREAPHPNLNRPLSVGRRQVGGVETIYVVLADADEKLAAVVPERPLEWEEAAEVLQSVEKGLAHLHAYGLIHGSVSPETVQAVGYTIQLETESVRRLGKKPRQEWTKPIYLAPESGTANTTTAADVWCLGATLFEVLAQEPYGTPGAELEEGLPLGGIISRCLERNPATRCTLKEAPGFEKAQPAAEAPAAQAAKPEPVKPEPVKAEAARPEAVRPEPAKPKAADSAPAKAQPRQAAPAAVEEPKATPRVEQAPIAAERAAPSEAGTQNKTATESKPAPAERTAPPPRPVDTRVPGPATTSARPTAGARPITPAAPHPLTPHPLTPHPLTPKPAPRQVMKEDMALVPVGKRQKKVQGKRQAVGARIRTLDGPSRETQEDIAAPVGPAARILIVSKRANFARGIIAGALLAALFIAAVWFIIIPKLQSPQESGVNVEAAHAAPPIADEEIGAAAASAPLSPMPAPTSRVPAANPPGSTSGGDSSDAPSSDDGSQPVVRKTPERFHVVLSSADTRADAATRLDKLSQEHPDLFLQVMPTTSDTGARIYFIIAGGLMSRSEADELRQRIVGKGFKSVEIVPYRP